MDYTHYAERPCKHGSEKVYGTPIPEHYLDTLWRLEDVFRALEQQIGTKRFAFWVAASDRTREKFVDVARKHHVSIDSGKRYLQKAQEVLSDKMKASGLWY